MFHNCEDIQILNVQKNASLKNNDFEEGGQRSTQNIPPTTISLTLKKPKLTTKISKTTPSTNKDVPCSSNSVTTMEIDEDESNGDSDASTSTDYPLIQRAKRTKGKKRKQKSVTHSVSFYFMI